MAPAIDPKDPIEIIKIYHDLNNLSQNLLSIAELSKDPDLMPVIKPLVLNLNNIAKRILALQKL